MVPLAAAVLAVLAGLSSLYGNRLAESMISMGDEAVLDQTQAADTWNEYEAQSLKKHIESELVFVTTDPTAKRRFASLEKMYAARQKPLQTQAKNLEKQRSEALARMERIDKQKVRSDVATGLFQIAIVLSSIGALTRRPLLFTIGIAGGVVGLIYCVLAFFP